MLVHAQKVRETLKIIEMLTYSCESSKALHDLSNRLDEALIAFKKEIPSNSEGIIVRPAIAQRTRLESQIKRAKHIVQKYSSLQLQSRKGPKHLNAAFRCRVRRKASALRKVYIYSYNFYFYTLCCTFPGCSSSTSSKAFKINHFASGISISKTRVATSVHIRVYNRYGTIHITHIFLHSYLN